MSILDNCRSSGYTSDLRAVAYETLFWRTSNHVTAWLFPVKNNFFKSSSMSENILQNVSCLLSLRLVRTTKWLFNYWKYILKFTESAAWNTSRNITYNGKLLKIKEKSLRNTCYGVNFCESCGKEARNFTKIWTLHRCFTYIKPK